jgi:hypothetical protein
MAWLAYLRSYIYLAVNTNKTLIIDYFWKLDAIFSHLKANFC